MKSVNRILIYRTDRLGDLIVTTVLLQYLQQCFPKSQICCVVSSRNYKALEFDNNIKLLIYKKEDSLFEKWKLFLQARAFKPDMSFCLSPGFFSFSCAALSGATFRLTYSSSGKKRRRMAKRLLYTHCSYLLSKKPQPISKMKYIGLSFLEVLGDLMPIPNQDQLPDLYIARDKNKLNLLPVGEAVGVHLDRRWIERGVPRYAIIMILKRIQSEVRRPLIITAEMDYFPDLLSELPSSEAIPSSQQGLRTLSEKLSSSTCLFYVFDQPDFQIWASLIESCQFWITHEGGAVHVAGAVKTPVVVLIWAANIWRYECVLNEWVSWKNLFTARWCQQASDVQSDVLSAIQEMQAKLKAGL